MLNHLKVYAKNRQIVHLKLVVKEMIDNIKETKMPLEIVRDTYCEVMIVLNEYLVNGTYNVKCDPVDLMIFYDIEEKETLTEIFLEVFKEIIRQIEQTNKKTSIKLDIEKIKQFIEMTYDRTEFSVQLVADEFNTSISYLSQYCKEHMQMTILDYITLLRIEKAKKLIENSGESIQYISEQVGYINVSSFIRRFKQVTGKTPGEFRKELKR